MGGCHSKGFTREVHFDAPEPRDAGEEIAGSADQVPSAAHDVVESQGTGNLAGQVALRHRDQGDGHFPAARACFTGAADSPAGVEAQEFELGLAPTAQPASREAASLEVAISGEDVDRNGTSRGRPINDVRGGRRGGGAAVRQREADDWSQQ